VRLDHLLSKETHSCQVCSGLDAFVIWSSISLVAIEVKGWHSIQACEDISGVDHRRKGSLSRFEGA